MSKSGRAVFAVCVAWALCAHARPAHDSAGGGEWIEEHPKDPVNAYLSFMRFRPGARTHVVRFSGPCT